MLPFPLLPPLELLPLFAFVSLLALLGAWIDSCGKPFFSDSCAFCAST